MADTSHLYVIFRKKYASENIPGNSSSDSILHKTILHKNLWVLKDAIDIYTIDENESMKSGLKNALYYLVID